jgi:hypothetical protein
MSNSEAQNTEIKAIDALAIIHVYAKGEEEDPTPFMTDFLKVFEISKTQFLNHIIDIIEQIKFCNYEQLPEFYAKTQQWENEENTVILVQNELMILDFLKTNYFDTHNHKTTSLAEFLIRYFDETDPSKFFPEPLIRHNLVAFLSSANVVEYVSMMDNQKMTEQFARDTAKSARLENFDLFEEDLKLIKDFQTQWKNAPISEVEVLKQVSIQILNMLSKAYYVQSENGEWICDQYDIYNFIWNFGERKLKELKEC